MQEFINDFESYLFLQKQVAANTYNAYKKDVKEFLLYLHLNGRSVDGLEQIDFQKFLNNLIKKQKSLSIGLRAVASLKMLARYLNEKHSKPDFSEVIYIANNFPILCTKEKINYLIDYYQTKPYRYENLRITLILMILNSGKIGINQLVNLKIGNIDFEAKIIKFNKTAKTKFSIIMNSDFFTLINIYLSLCTEKTDYLFYIKHGISIKPASNASIWSLLRSLIKQPMKTKILSTCHEIIDQEIYTEYKTNHPRF